LERRTKLYKPDDHKAIGIRVDGAAGYEKSLLRHSGMGLASGIAPVLQEKAPERARLLSFFLLQLRLN
tara:strand:- start:777 stop:980 length:204 start_codon:yes stop_codon:yes gene_type:complete